MQLETLQPGQILARGVCRHLISCGFAVLEEFSPKRGARVDVIALGPNGDIWVVECKSSRADFNSDHKWQGYLEFCDRFFWAVDAQFPHEILPAGTGIIIADGYDAQILTMAPDTPLHAARRRKITHKFATDAANRLRGYRDPQARL